MCQAYSVYGLKVLADQPIPGLLPSVDTGGGADLRVWLNRLPPWDSQSDEALWYRSPFDNGIEIRQVNGAGWLRLVYPDGYEFLMNPMGGEVWSRWPAGATIQHATPLLIGPVFGFILRMREICCLHASAVAIGNKSIALCGSAHAGKSTTAGAFANLGFAVLTDDIVALAEEGQTFLAQPGYPRLCLWPEGAASVYGPSRILPRMAPDGEKRYLDLAANGHRFQTQPLPLSAIYLLGERAGGAGYPKVEPVPEKTALLNLVANTYLNVLLDGRLRSLEFSLLGRLASRVPVRRAIRHKDPAGLPDFCAAILEDQRSLSVTDGTR